MKTAIVVRTGLSCSFYLYIPCYNYNSLRRVCIVRELFWFRERRLGGYCSCCRCCCFLCKIYVYFLFFFNGSKNEEEVTRATLLSFFAVGRKYSRPTVNRNGIKINEIRGMNRKIYCTP